MGEQRLIRNRESGFPIQLLRPHIVRHDGQMKTRISGRSGLSEQNAEKMGADSLPPFFLNNGDADFPGAVFFSAVHQTGASDRNGVFFRNKNKKVRNVKEGEEFLVFSLESGRYPGWASVSTPEGENGTAYVWSDALRYE